MTPKARHGCLLRRMELRLTSLFGPAGNDTAGSALRDKPLHLRICGGIAGIWMMLLVLKAAAWYWPEIVGRMFPYGQLGIKRLVGFVPFSVDEVAGALLVLTGIAFALRAIVQVIRRRRRLRNAVACGILLVISAVCLIDSWGGILTAGRAEYLRERLGWTIPSEDSVRTDELVRWSEELVAAINAEYSAFPEERRYGTGSIVETETAIDRGYQTLTTTLKLPASYGVARGRAKPMLFSKIAAYQNTLGYSSPFTQELLYCDLMPDTDVPYVIAHERSHLDGVTLEDEAALLGYLACEYSGDPYVRYCGCWQALFMLMPRLYDADKDKCSAIIASIAPGPRADFERYLQFAGQYRTPMADLFDKAYDLQFKLTKDARGIRSYEDIALLAAFARHNGDSLRCRQ